LELPFNLSGANSLLTLSPNPAPLTERPTRPGQPSLPRRPFGKPDSEIAQPPGGFMGVFPPHDGRTRLKSRTILMRVYQIF
jgi:hypothetical protein